MTGWVVAVLRLARISAPQIKETSVMDKSYVNPLGYERIPKLLLRYALPAITSMVVNAIYNLVDQIFIGHAVGYLGNAATTVTFPLVMITLGFSTMLGAGGSAFASIRLGEGNAKLAERAMGNVFILALVFGVAVMACGLIWVEPILSLFGATPANMAYSVDYAKYILMGMPFSILSVCLSNLTRTDGKPMLAMWSLLVGAVLNVGLDAWFMFGFGWGVAGAAIATSISQGVSALLLVVYFWKFGRMRFGKNALTFDPKVCLRLMNLGISSCLLQLAGSALQVVLNNALVTWGDRSAVSGDVALSAMGIVLKIVMIFNSVCIGINIGNQPILGFNRGAGKPRRIRQAYLLAAGSATVISTLGWLVFMCWPDAVLGLFGAEDAGFMAFAVHAMRTYLSCMFLIGFQMVSTGYFQATGQPMKATVLSTLRQIVLLIPLILVLPQFFGLDGVLYAGPIADALAFCVVAAFIVREMRKLNKWIAATESA